MYHLPGPYHGKVLCALGTAIIKKELPPDNAPKVTWQKVRPKGFPYSLPSVGPLADSGVQAVSPQVTRR